MSRIWGTGLFALILALQASGVNAANSCATDLNGDGVTNEADAQIFQSTLGKSSGEAGFIAAADFDGDGSVTPADFAIFLSCN